MGSPVGSDRDGYFYSNGKMITAQTGNFQFLGVAYVYTERTGSSHEEVSCMARDDAQHSPIICDDSVSGVSAGTAVGALQRCIEERPPSFRVLQ